MSTCLGALKFISLAIVFACLATYSVGCASMPQSMNMFGSNLVGGVPPQSEPPVESGKGTTFSDIASKK